MEDSNWWLASAGEYQEDTRTRKGPWTIQEDMELTRYISLHGDGHWNFLAKAAGLKRTGKSCRLRWLNYLRPDLKRSKITPEEKHLIIKLHGLLGNRWSRIAQSLPGRTDNEIKNYWRTLIKKKTNVQGENCSNGIEADNRVHFERSMVSYCVTASSPKVHDLDSAEHLTSFRGKNSDEIMLQTNTIPYLQEHISSQAIPISEGNYDYELQREILSPFRVNEDGQPSGALQEHFEESHNHWLPYYFSIGPLANMLSSEFFADGATHDGEITPSSSYMVACPEAFYDDHTYSNHSDVLWNMDEQDDRFVRSPQSECGDNRLLY